MLDNIQYDTRCYCNVRSKADISQLNLPHGLIVIKTLLFYLDLIICSDVIFCMHDFPVCLFNPAFRGCQNPINGLLNCYDWKLRDRSVWAEFLTDDPAAWKVRVGEHFMFRDDATQLDVNIERILFHPARNRQYTHARRLLIYLLTCPPPPKKK